MKISLILIGIFFFSYLTAQDGSNIRYYEPEDLDSTFVGKFCHIDFGGISFRGRIIDTLEIEIKGKRMKFHEHRVDNGFNNWFEEQYLIAVTARNQPEIRLQNSRIDRLTTDRIYVTSTLEYYHSKSPIDTITVIRHWYARNNIAKVLVKNRY